VFLFNYELFYCSIVKLLNCSIVCNRNADNAEKRGLNADFFFEVKNNYYICKKLKMFFYSKIMYKTIILKNYVEKRVNLYFTKSKF